jgi:hypothetical protein
MHSNEEESKNESIALRLSPHTFQVICQQQQQQQQQAAAASSRTETGRHASCGANLHRLRLVFGRRFVERRMRASVTAFNG